MQHDSEDKKCAPVSTNQDIAEIEAEKNTVKTMASYFEHLI